MSNGLKKAGSSRIFRPVRPPSCLAHWSSRSKSPNSCSPFLSFWVSAGNITSLFRCTWVTTAVDPKRLPDFFQDSWMPAAQFFLHMHCATAEQVFLTHQLCVLSWEPVPHLLWCWRLLSCSWMRLSILFEISFLLVMNWMKHSMWSVESEVWVIWPREKDIAPGHSLFDCFFRRITHG